MKAIIPCAGFGTRFSGVPKSLLNIDNGTVILDKILNKIDFDTYLITNALSDHLFQEKYANRDNISILCNGLLHNTQDCGCLDNIQHLIEKENINDDIMIIVGDILFDFSLDEILTQFNSTKTITIPIKKIQNKLSISQTLLSGGLTIRDDNVIDTFIEHEVYEQAEYIELGIYLIAKEYLYTINECINHYKHDAPGYLIEYMHKLIPIYGAEIIGYWEHIIEYIDYISYLERRKSQ
jgi:glucose-1-phosphate thymidylyltransferase